MRDSIAGLLALVTAGWFSGPATADDRAGAFAVVELDVAGKVVEILPGDGMPMVRSDVAGAASNYHARFTDGAVTVDAVGGLVVFVAGDSPPDLLPHSRVATGDGLVEAAWLSDASGRYRHGVLGDRLEAAALRVRLDDDAVLILQAGDDAVFEDLQPRLTDLDGDGRDEIIVVKSYLDRGAALAVAGLDANGDLAILAETPPIGRSNRWLNPVGAADFDGDGAVEIAYVETPHIGGTLMIWEWRGGGLVREHAEPGFSNHAIGSTELGLSAIADFDGDGLMDLAVPGRHRDRLRIISLAGGRFRELADIALGGVVATAIAPVGRSLILGLEDGRLLALRFAP